MTSVPEVNPVVRRGQSSDEPAESVRAHHGGDHTEYKSDVAHSEGPLWGIMMKLGLVLLFAAYVHGCGTPTYEPSVSRVVNGVDARPYSWPWQISLQYLSGSTYRHTCGGTLLTPEWVMTAGHCIGSVERIVVHPHWDDNCLSCGNDIAMIKLASPVDLNDKVQPSCLPESGQIVPNNDPCYITGWGRLYSGGPIASKLQQALLPVVGHSICSRSDWWGSTVKTTMVCAGGDIRSGCHGDSGGPLNCRGGDGRWYVQGVTSFVSSRGCNTPLKPTVFTRTSSFTKWISDTLLQY
ncbi:Chymotrypsin-like elastase family member 3B [Collichthys lucidus]|uniref:Chymotrypsin-like elastase family member 3B n=1 Tax=Collichthys lucidus TaxID=240159 RepID=A0A4U5UJK4_COLLU|nr:Chymotrypsin-like elastase family member 3B [Collichthys lucidus]